MGIYNGTHYVVHFRNGDLWYFYSVKNRGIFFRRFSPQGKWEEPVDLFLNTQEDFSVRVDNLDHLHLICRSVMGDILYMHYDGKVWSRQVLSSFDVVRYVIRYPVILPIKNQIHVIFAVGTAFNTGLWSLYHYSWDGKEWHSAEITKLTAGQRLSPFYIDLSDKYIHLVYRGLSSSRYQIFYCRYHIEHGIWATPENVTQSAADCNTPSILIRDDRLHLIWTSLEKNNLTVKYKSKAIRMQNKTEWTPETDLSKASANAAFPNLIWADEKLWCIWSQTDTLFGCYSSDGGAVWSRPEAINSGDGSFHRIHYSTNNPQETESFQLQWILGNVSEALFLPVVNHSIKLPEYFGDPGSAGIELKIKPETKIESKIEFKIDPLSRGKQPGKPSLENALLAELDKQEENYGTVLNKLEEQAKLDDAILAGTREIISQLKVNTEKLQALLLDMEQIKNDIKALQSKGLLSRIFNK